MTELLQVAAPSVERVVCAWLRPLGRAGTWRLAGDVLPFRLVNRVAGADDPTQGIDIPILSVHTFAIRDEALDESILTHQRMMYLARFPFTDIELPSSEIVNVNYLECVEKPIQIDYGDPNLLRYVGRYRIGVDFVEFSLPDSGS